MPPAPLRAAGVERFKVARGAINRMGPILAVFIGAVVVWMISFLVLFPAVIFPALGLDQKIAVIMAPGGLITMVAALIVYLNLPGRLDLGADGVLIDLRDSEKQYVSFADIIDAPRYDEHVMGKHFIGVSLELRSGGAVKVPMGEDQFGADKRVAALSDRIRAALDAYRRREQGDDASALARGARSPEEWHRRLRGLGEGANAGPREAPVPIDRLWRIVEDPSAEPPIRAGAAAALSAGLDDAGKQRLRIAAESTAAPKLRIALESAAAGDDDAVVAALAEVEGEAAR